MTPHRQSYILEVSMICINYGQNMQQHLTFKCKYAITT